MATYRRMPQVDAIVRDAAERFKGLGATIETVLIPMHRLGSAIWLPIAAEGATMQVANRRRQKRKIQQPIDQDRGIGRSLKRRRHAINVFSLPEMLQRSRAAPPNHQKLAGSRRRRDDVKEAARNHATPAAGRRGVTAIRIGDEGERCVVSQGLDARIVELVSTQLRPGRAKTAAIDEARATIAEMQPPLGEGGRYAQ